MKYVKQLSVGDIVTLTSDGAKAHRAHHATQNAAAAAAIGVVAAPVALGAGIGIVAAGTAVGVSSAAAGGVVGGVTGVGTSAFGSSSESGTLGQVVTKQPCWWGQNGHDYEVEWEDGSTSLHQSIHLTKQSQIG